MVIDTTEFIIINLPAAQSFGGMDEENMKDVYKSLECEIRAQFLRYFDILIYC